LPPPPVTSRQRGRVCGGAWGRWVLGTLVALALVAVAVQGWLLAGVRAELRRVTERLQVRGDTGTPGGLGDMGRSPPEKPAAHLIGEGGTLGHQSPTGAGGMNGDTVTQTPGPQRGEVHLGAPALRTCAHALLRIRKRTPRYPEPLDLLLNKGVHCPPAAGGGPWARSSFWGGLVRLEEGDEVFAQVQEPHLVLALDGTRSYFGMFMV
ncbi:TNF14 factor, partial [Sapayoa aenigma]|nr:TNF14 factor [Sapayoa aenigma]